MTDASGQVRAGAGDKFRQINKFVETVAHLLEDAGLKGRETLSLVDMGAGKGYLTFAVYDYLRNTLGLRRASVVGVEARAELVELCNRVAGEAGFGGLEFRQGNIRDYEPGAVDMLVALHAATRRTDEPLQGHPRGRRRVITAPCCHKSCGADRGAEVLADVAARDFCWTQRSVADTLRALWLEAFGLPKRVFEFVDRATRKKQLIAAAAERAPARRLLSEIAR